VTETLFGDHPRLKIVIRGTSVSGNAKTRHAAIPTDHILKNGERKWRSITYSTKEAKAFTERVQSIARYECLKVRWVMPEYCWVGITIYNIAQDRDNVSKTVCDALQGFAFANDGRILDGPITKRKDAGGPRVEVVIHAVDPRLFGY
jgi:Holliday junction resolvase RusA-like endonuclease